jgi:uncharacterized protein YggL (DUF469 family)
MTKKRTRQSTRRQAKKLEMTSIQIAILNGLSRDLDQFLEEQRQQAAPDLIDQAAVLNAVSEEQNTQRVAGSRKAMG